MYCKWTTARLKNVEDIDAVKAIWKQNAPAFESLPGFLFMYHFQGVDDPAEIRAITGWRTYEDAANASSAELRDLVLRTAGPYYVSPPTAQVWVTDEVDVDVLAAQLAS